MQRSYRVFIVVVVLALASHAQTVPPAEPEIQDNSFLIEEAYNQEFGVVQHISTFIRLWNSGDWVYSFTQEWPMPGDPRHQLSVSTRVTVAVELTNSDTTVAKREPLLSDIPLGLDYAG